MTKYRYTGNTRQNKTIQIEFEAAKKNEARKKVALFEKKRGLVDGNLEEERIFIYKVSKNGGKPVKGEQRAYNATELTNALENLGYEVHRVEKKLFNFKGSVPTSEVVSFISLSADLLKQKLRFDEILKLISEDVTNKRMKQTIKEIEKDLKDGKDGDQVYGKHQGIFGKFTTYMLSVASTSGNMAEVFESTAKFLERDAEFKKNLRKSLLMPMITLFAVFGVVIAYVAYIFPKTAEMFVKFDIDLPPMTAATMDFSNYLEANWIILTISTLLPIIIAVIFFQTKKGRLWFDKHIIKIPIIGTLLHRTSIEIFSRVFYTLYSGSGENVDVIRIAAEASRNNYIEHRIKSIAIPMMLKDGAGLLESLEATGVFPKTALSRYRLGFESGTLKDNAKQLADYYEAQTSHKMEQTITSINAVISLFIMIVMIAITVISSETAVIQPNSPI
ncbi:MAG: type II secretion system F family protein [Candidatus Marinimicrobia bacterium]|nr:type II secretion system F family protein [Candidatus Neomarinimicrobiota bacterium]MCF7880572.1 type II secretion system F family protein [Candidatus Neomarinimicrobiota bacterium]